METWKHGNETILLVDDEETVINVASQLLSRIGYRVVTAATCDEAVRIYRENHDTIDLVIMDMIMPDAESGEIVDRIREIDSGAKILLSSGYNLNEQAAAILERGCCGFMQKPFSIHTLSEKVREALES